MGGVILLQTFLGGAGSHLSGGGIPGLEPFAESFLRFVWTNREIIKTIFESPLPSATRAHAHTRTHTSPEDEERVPVESYLRKERLLLAMLMHIMAHSGAFDAHVQVCVCVCVCVCVGGCCISFAY